MEKILSFTPLIVAVLGGWAILNGVLHDAFVLAQGRKYDRDLLRLLMDGHILITCGLVMGVSYFGLKNQDTTAYLIAGIAALSLLIYCAMIFPFLKSVGMIVLNLIVLTLVTIHFIQYKS